MNMQPAPSPVAPHTTNQNRRCEGIKSPGLLLRPELAAFYALSAQDRFPAQQLHAKGILAELVFNRGRD